MKVLHKLFNTKASSINDDAKTVDFIISTNQVDRYGDVVDQKSWNLKSYEQNPIVLWGHNPDEPENVLGVATNIRTSDDGSSTTATLNFATDVPGNKAAMVFDLIKRGILRTVSVGFVPHTMEYEDDTPILKDNELLEISVVPIPANAGAVALSLKDGSLHEKDAKWLLDSMGKESELIKRELANLTTKEKSMTEEQAQALLDAMDKTNEKLDTVLEENKTLREQVEALKPAEETEEEKTARLAAEAKAQEDANVAAGLNPDGSAKSGTDGDQGGAEDVEFDDDTELTPEQEAELDAIHAAKLAELEGAAV
jgi:HK97 family phage prohead protease